MTAAQMKAYFLAEYDAATSFAAPGWEDTEISSFLNIAQDSIVSELYKNGDIHKISELLTTLTDLSCLLHPTIANGIYIADSDVDATMLAEYFYYVSSRINITRTNPDVRAEYIPAELVTRDVAPKFFVTPFNAAWFKYPKIFMESLEVQAALPRFVFLVDYYTTVPQVNVSVQIGEITYIKRPTRIDITGGTTTELNESLHQLIVQLAVQEALKAIKVTKVATQ